MNINPEILRSHSLITKAYTIAKCSNNNNNTNLLLRALKDTNNCIENSMTPSLNNSNDCVSTIDCNTVVPIVDNVCLKPSVDSDSSLYETDSLARPFKRARNHQCQNWSVCNTSIPNARLGVLLSISTCAPQRRCKHDEKINQWWIDQSVSKKEIKFVQINTYTTWLSFLYKQSFSNKKNPLFQHTYLTIIHEDDENDHGKILISRIERNPTASMYFIKGLSKALHFTEVKSVIQNRDYLQEVYPGTTIDTISTNKCIDTPNIKFINHIPHAQDDPDQIKLNKLASKLRDIFPVISNLFSHSNYNKRNTPYINIGYSTTDCNKYSSHRSTMLGNIKPSLSLHQIKAVPMVQKQVIGNLVMDIIETMGNDALYYPSKDQASLERNLLRLKFAEALGLDTCDNRVNKFFRTEGISFVMNILVSPHHDSLNASKSLDHTLSLNTSISINQDNHSLIDVLSKLGVLVDRNKDRLTLSLSIMIYSRRCLDNYESLRRRISTARMSSKHPKRDCIDNKLLSCLLPILQDVDSKLNFNRFFDNPTEEYNKLRFKSIGNQLSTRYTLVSANYDHMVRYYLIQLCYRKKVHWKIYILNHKSRCTLLYFTLCCVFTMTSLSWMPK